MSKRLFDFVMATLLLLALWPVFLLTTLVLLVIAGGPVFYLGERMCSPTRSFKQIKFRTMPVGTDAKGGVTGGDKTREISALHRFLRRTRVDELPQLINVFKGEMSLVGPRPPLRTYVEAYPAIYNQVLQSRPGVTGLASLRFHKFEERLLAQCRTSRETEAVYRRRCIPRKARFDLIYQRRRTLWLDIVLFAETAWMPFNLILRGSDRREAPARSAPSLAAREARVGSARPEVAPAAPLAARRKKPS